MIMCIQNLVKFCQFILKILSKNKILTSIKGRNSVEILRKMTLYNPNVGLVIDNVYIQNLVNFCPFILKILCIHQILTSIKGSVANLRKMMHYNPNVDLINGNVYTKFCLNPSIRNQYIEQKPNYDGMTE